MKYDLIIFDLGRVLVRFDHSISAKKFAKRYGLDEKYLYGLFFDSRLTKLHDEGKLSSYEFYRAVKKKLMIKIKYKEFKGYWNDIFYPNPGMVKIIKRLKTKYRLYLMSNTNKLHFEYIKSKFRIIKYFDKLILSYEVGKLKPDPIIYKHALRLANLPPNKVLYIDDRPELIKGAAKLGIDGIVFKSIYQLKRDLKKFTLRRCFMRKKINS